jgi:predicted transposase/invertase (TIGR01784 family)
MLTGKRIEATGDLAFKKVFGSVGNEDIVAGLFEDFFGFKPTNVVITNPYDIKAYARKLKDSGGDFSILRETLNDVGADLITSDFIAEMQVRKQDVYGARSLYYAFSKYCSNYARNENAYEDLKPVFSLNILKEPFFKGDDDAVKVFRLRDEYTGVGLDREYIVVGYFELAKHEYRNEHQKIWQMFFAGEELPENTPSYIKKADDIIEVVNLREEERTMLSYEEKARADQMAYYSTARREGRDEGRAEGRTEGRTEGLFDVARKLKAEGAEKALIAKVTGLSEKEMALL